MSDQVFPTDFPPLVAGAGVKLMGDDGTQAGYVRLEDVIAGGNTNTSVHGDLTGSLLSPTVIAIDGITVVTTGASTDDVLKYDGAKFTPAPAETILDGGYF